MALREVQSPDQIETELKDFVRTEELRPDMLITALPTSLAYIRKLDLPFRNPKKLRQVIKYQMEPLVPHAVDDLVTDFLAPRKGEPISAIGIEKGSLSDHLKTLAGADLQPNRVSLQDIALFSLYLETCRGDLEEPVAIVRLGGEETAVQVIRDGRLDFIRVFPGGKEPKELLKETFGIYSLKRPLESLSEIHVTGALAADKSIVDRIGEVMAVKTSLWRPFDAVKYRGEKIEDDLQAMLSVSLGLALSGGNGADKIFDLRREEFAPQTTGNIKGLRLYIFSALLFFVGLWTFQVYQMLHIEEIRYGERKEEIRRVFTETFPHARQMVKGQELAQMRQSIGEEKGKYQWLSHLMAQGPVLETLLNLTRSIAGFTDVRVGNFSMEGGVVHLDGSTSSFKTVDNLKSKLSGSFNSVKLVGAKMDNRERVVKFSFVLEKKP